MGDADVAPEELWAVSFQEHQTAQLRRILDSTPEERLAWLEDAIAFAQAAGALPRRRQDFTMAMSDVAFPAAYEVRLEVAPRGEAIHTFGYPGASGVGTTLGFEIITTSGSRWRGEVMTGRGGVAKPVTGAFSTPNETRLCVIAGGDAYLVDVERPGAFEAVDAAGPVTGVRPLLHEEMLLLHSPWHITAIDRDGVRWHTARLSIEGVRIDEIQGISLAGVADPDDDEPKNFVIDLRTGLHEGGAPFQ
jgi:hypothetical protein